MVPLVALVPKTAENCGIPGIPQEVLEAAGRFDEQYRVRERAVLAAAPWRDEPGMTVDFYDGTHGGS